MKLKIGDEEVNINICKRWKKRDPHDNSSDTALDAPLGVDNDTGQSKQQGKQMKDRVCGKKP